MTDLVAELEPQLEQHRVELTGYCYRMLGSAFEADDAVQETLLRAWQAVDRFEGRSALRTWLYSIATNVCLDMLKASQRRVRPIDMGPAATAPSDPGRTLPADAWLEPIPDRRVLPADDGPAEAVAQRETIKLAFVAALQHLPPRQRAVLILREVLRWKADEVATLIDTTVPAVNSALQRARAALAACGVTDSDEATSIEEGQQALAATYMKAFERFDVHSLITLLHMDATLSIPPHELWLRGPEEISRWLHGPGRGCLGSRLTPVEANGSPAFGQYRPDPQRGGHKPWALQVLEVSNGQITGLSSYLDTQRLFPLFGLPLRLEP